MSTWLALALAAACGPPGLAATSAAATPGPELELTPESPRQRNSVERPLQIELPAEHAPPISGWRPPLYPVPWAISPFDHFYFTRPIAADEINWPLPSYRYAGVFFEDVVHTGVDINARHGTPILAAGPGTVVWADWGLFLEAPGVLEDPYGMAVVVRMDFGHSGEPLYSVYAHMSKILAVRGQRVEAGDVLGLVGDTGVATGPHIHFEVRWGENSFHHTYNPELWMVPPEGRGVLVGRLTDPRGVPLRLLDVQVRHTVSDEVRLARTYGAGAANSDPIYQENLVLGDLPAGVYKLTFRWDNAERQEWITVLAGQVAYFAYRGGDDFHVGPPPMPLLEGLSLASP